MRRMSPLDAAALLLIPLAIYGVSRVFVTKRGRRAVPILGGFLVWVSVAMFLYGILALMFK